MLTIGAAELVLLGVIVVVPVGIAAVLAYLFLFKAKPPG